MSSQEPLVPLFMPALIVVLHSAETKKGSPLAEEEVISIRDRAPVIMIERADARSMEEKRGWSDLDPERAWEQWQEARKMFAASDDSGEG